MERDFDGHPRWAREALHRSQGRRRFLLSKFTLSVEAFLLMVDDAVGLAHFKSASKTHYSKRSACVNFTLRRT